MTSKMTWASSVAPLRRQEFAWYFSSRFVNTLGATMATVAVTFATLDITDSVAALGVVLAARTIPLVLLLLFGGVLSDRFSRVAVIQVSNVIAATSQAGLAALILTGNAEIWSVAAISAVNGAVSAASMPALAGMVPQLVPRDQLQQANALLSLSRNGLNVIGPTLGALAVVTVGSGWALALDALAWAVATMLMIPVRVPRPAGGPSDSVVRALADGWTFFRTTTWLWVVVAGFGVMNAIHAGAWLTLGPTVAEDTIGRQGWGFVLSAEAIGLVLMTIVMLRVPLRRPLLSGMLGCALFMLPLLVLGIHPTLLLLAGAALLAGAGMEVFGLGWNVAMQEQVDERMLSRASSYDMLGSFIAIPVGQLTIAPLAASFGASTVLVWSGIIYAATCLLVLCSRSVRTLGRTPAPSPLPPSTD